MKKSILSIVALMVHSVLAFAQLPNNSFENWTSMGSYNNPDGWYNLNAMTSSMSVYTVTKGTGGASGGGSSYLKLTTKNVSGMGIMPGVAVSGVIDMATFKAKSGFPFTQRPVKLTGNWQYMASGSDEGFVAVYLTKWNSGMMMRDTIAKATQTLSSMAMSWTAFNLNLTYMSTAMPDSAIIILSASGITPVANSYLYVDNLAFVGSVTGINAIGNLGSTISAYPNPVSDNIFVELNVQKTSILKLQLVDLRGQLIKEVDGGQILGKYTTVINTSDVTKGVYFLRINVNDIVEVKKVIIQ